MNFFKSNIFLAAVSVIALWIILLCIYTPSRPAAVFFCIAAASTIALALYRRLSWSSRGGVILLIIAAALTGSGVILNDWYFTTFSGGSDSAPILQNFDAARNWEYLTISNIEDLRTDRFPGICFNRASGYPYLMATLMLPFEPSLAFALGFNMLCVLLTIILSGNITRRCFGDRGNAPAFCSMIVLSANCYFMVTGTIFIKDALIQLLFAAMVYLLMAIRLRLQTLQRLLVCSGGVLLLIALVRHQLIPLLVPGFALLLCGKRGLWPTAAMLGLFSALIYIIVMSLPTLEHYDVVFSVLSGPRITHPEIDSTFVMDNSRLQLIHSITGNLDEQMPWMRLLWLPATMLCQFLIPFPWNFTRDIIYGPTQFYAHIAFPGYLAGIILGYYMLFKARRGPRDINLLLTWGIMLYAAVAYLWSGSISRYCLMFIPLAAPAISYVLITALHKRSLYIWTSACSLVLATGLLACYHISH